jgi:perosamine synthetase
MLTLQPRHRLDIRLRDFAYALLSAAWARNPDRLTARVEAGWSPGGQALACRSVRSGFHLLLDSLALPAGSEVLVSAVTHPDMVRILEAHGLVAVPVDLDVATLAPRLELAERLMTARTAAILVAHLFGGRVAMGPVRAFAERHRLQVWEDCAQAFTGAGGGDSNADVSMYSFGALKTCTALGGALMKVKDASLLARMRAAHCRWPLQARSDYATSVLKFLAFTLVTRPLPYGVLAALHRALGRDFDITINGSVKAFRPGRLLPQLEVRPSAPLLATLTYRLQTFDNPRLRRRAAAGAWLNAHLPGNLTLAGHGMESRTHWLFPVISREPDQLILACRQAGIDAARGASSVTLVPAPRDRPEADPAAARQMMAGLVFLPAYPELSRRSVMRLVAAVGGAIPEFRVKAETRPGRVMQS